MDSEEAEEAIAAEEAILTKEGTIEGPQGTMNTRLSVEGYTVIRIMLKKRRQMVSLKKDTKRITQNKRDLVQCFQLNPPP